MSKKYVFEYSESNTGVIIVKADSDAAALDLAQTGDGKILIKKCDWTIGDQIK
jgi:hypothetical protein